jgi:hypothetical protein
MGIMNISSPAPLKNFVDAQVTGGRYSSLSEYREYSSAPMKSVKPKNGCGKDPLRQAGQADRNDSSRLGQNEGGCTCSRRKT